MRPRKSRRSSRTPAPRSPSSKCFASIPGEVVAASPGIAVCYWKCGLEKGGAAFSHTVPTRAISALRRLQRALPDDDTTTEGVIRMNGAMPKQEPVRHDFSKIRSYMALPNLIDVQRRSYERFLQMNLLPEEREDAGLQSVFTSVFPFSDFRETCSLDFVKFAIGNWECKCGQLKGLEHLRMTCANCGSKIITDHPHEETVNCQKCGVINKNRVEVCDICGNPVDLQMKYSVEECQERGMTYSVPLKVTFRLFVYDKDPDTGVKHMRDAKEEEVFFGDIPLMTENGTFIINGTERVIVSQLHRSPGVFFTKESAHTFLAKIIPYRGSWVEFEYDQKNILYVRIDRKRKFLGSVFLRALGLTTDEEILRQFYTPIKVRLKA